MKPELREREAPETNAGFFVTGRIATAKRSGWWRLSAGGENIKAFLAEGCFLEPRKGDLVLAVRTEDGRAFIVQVLERAEGSGKAAVRLPQDATLAAGDGNGGLEIQAGELSLTGGILSSVFKRVSTAAGVVEAKAELLRETYRRRYEDVREVKDSRLGRVRCVVESLLSLRGRTVDVVAKKRLKMDGEAIDIG